MRSPVSAYSLASCRLVSSGQVTGPPSAATRPDRDVRVGEVRALGHEHDVGQRDEAAAEPDGGAVHRGDDRHAGTRPCRSRSGGRATSVSRRSVGVLGELVEVGEVAAGRERAAVAGEDDGARVGVGVELREQLGEAVVQLVVGGVELLGPVEADDADGAVGLDLDLGGQVVVVMMRAAPGCGGRRGCAGSATCRP